jgi:hypothetical protein
MELQPGVDGCFCLQDIHERYARIDEMAIGLKAGYRFFSRSELGGFRELGGVLIHIDRFGRLISGGGGRHRLAIAQILNLSIIPAQVGVVHQTFFDSGGFKILVKESRSLASSYGYR